MDRGAWWAAVHGVSESRPRLSDLAAAAAAGLVLPSPFFTVRLVYTVEGPNAMLADDLLRASSSELQQKFYHLLGGFSTCQSGN